VRGWPRRCTRVTCADRQDTQRQGWTGSPVCERCSEGQNLAQRERSQHRKDSRVLRVVD